MPLVEQSSYQKRPFYLLNAHWETVFPSMFKKGPEVPFVRERHELPDGDFLDVDYLKSGSHKNVLIITHGLEGGSDRFYVRRTADFFHKMGWDIVAWNCRSCSGEINRLPRFYHHGETGDLSYIVDHTLAQGYERVVLFGYSMGGSMSIKYLGERALDKRILGAITYSVPCNLKDSSDTLRERQNRLYEKRFIGKLVEKIRVKTEMFPGEISAEGLDVLDDFDVFHERYTAPLHGFKDAEDFFRQSTCDQFIADIKVPVLIANALNDPMLGDKCYPRVLADQSRYVYLETPKYGGHTGFLLSGKEHSWMEERGAQFLNEVILQG